MCVRLPCTYFPSDNLFGWREFTAAEHTSETPMEADVIVTNMAGSFPPNSASQRQTPQNRGRQLKADPPLPYRSRNLSSGTPSQSQRGGGNNFNKRGGRGNFRGH